MDSFVLHRGKNPEEGPECGAEWLRSIRFPPSILSSMQASPDSCFLTFMDASHGILQIDDAEYSFVVQVDPQTIVPGVKECFAERPASSCTDKPLRRKRHFDRIGIFSERVLVGALEDASTAKMVAHRIDLQAAILNRFPDLTEWSHKVAALLGGSNKHISKETMNS